MAFILLMAALPARADVVWPALYLESRMVTWWVIALGLVVEYLFVRKIFGFSVKQALVADVVMNIASVLLGILLIPAAGIAWEFFPGIILYKVFNTGTFNPGTWAMTFLFAVAINAALESLVIRWVFKAKAGKKGFWGLFAANAISVAVAFASLFVIFPEM
jgi:uncharacterized protein (DUF697 family)